MNSIGLASGRKGRLPVASPSPAMLWIGRFCNSRPLPLSTMLYVKSIVLSLVGELSPLEITNEAVANRDRHEGAFDADVDHILHTIAAYLLSM